MKDECPICFEEYEYSNDVESGKHRELAIAKMDFLKVCVDNTTLEGVTLYFHQ